MVQVDVIWSYAFGASYAAASVRTLAKTDAPLNNRVFNLPGSGRAAQCELEAIMAAV